ncbi:MAG: hypothetical protein IPP48_08975 [Chitinophagaceae bacterium]|nr:hypothetical protein [Chitinophagaceae bacterium]
MFNPNLTIESPANTLDKDVTIELKQANGSSDWLRLKKYSFHSTESFAGVSLTNASTLFSGLDGGDLKIGALSGNANIDFFSGGNRRMTIDYLGRVGIGTTVPSTSLEINSPNSEAFRINGPNAYQTFYNNSSYKGFIQAWTDGLGIGASNGNNLRLYSNGGFERFTILSNGNVGVHTINPSYPLEITGAINFNNSLFYLNGNLGTVGKVITSSGVTSTPTWQNPTNNLYATATKKSLITNHYLIEGGVDTDIEPLSYNFTVSENCMVLISFNMTVVSNVACLGCGNDKVLMYLSLDNVKQNVYSNYVPSHLGSQTISGSYLMPVTAGNHTIMPVFNHATGNLSLTAAGAIPNATSISYLFIKQ